MDVFVLRGGIQVVWIAFSYVSSLDRVVELVSCFGVQGCRLSTIV